MKNLKRFRKLIFWFTGIVTVIFFLLPYLWGAALRRTAHECQTEKESGLYVGEVCFLGSPDATRFRLYDANSGELMAERTYNDLDPGMVWSNDRVYYNMGASPAEYVKLPPTLFDRLRAKLP